jgi:hypothetical protein
MEDLQDVFAEDAVYDPENVHTSERHEGGVVWCLHCNRCYPYGWHRKGGSGLHMCPYDGCDGDAVMDAWPWEKLVRANDYPEDPEFGKRYPQYGE